MNKSQSEEAFGVLAEALFRQSSGLARVMFRRIKGPFSRSEASVLGRLEPEPLRITTLADLEGLAQPTMTTLVNSLEKRDMVTRGRSEDDGRVVLVALTDAGHAEIAKIRHQYRDILGGYLHDLSEGELAAIKSATQIMAALNQRLLDD